MRILAVTDFYPPHHLGGYELACERTLDALALRGHDTHVLTSTHGVGAPAREGNVHRWLKSYTEWPPGSRISTFGRLISKEIANQRAFRRAVDSIQPEIVYLWNLSHVSVSAAFMAEREGMNVCYRGMYWHEWDNDPWWGLWNQQSDSVLMQAAKWLPRKIFEAAGMIHYGDLELDYIHFPTEIQKQMTLDAGKPVGHAVVTGQSFAIDEFPIGEAHFPPNKSLYVGRVVREKGIETAIRALGMIHRQPGLPEMVLTVVGEETDVAWARRMHDLAAQLGVADQISWKGAVPPAKMPAVYREHDVFLMPSHSESFSLTTVEAMASGAVVVGTGAGGSAELMNHENDALVFEPEDAKGCARLVCRLMEDEELYTRLRRNAREKVERDFFFEATIDRIEAHLYEATGMRPEDDRP